jgi:hypothetical protein
LTVSLATATKDRIVKQMVANGGAADVSRFPSGTCAIDDVELALRKWCRKKTSQINASRLTFRAGILRQDVRSSSLILPVQRTQLNLCCTCAKPSQKLQSPFFDLSLTRKVNSERIVLLHSFDSFSHVGDSRITDVAALLETVADESFLPVSDPIGSLGRGQAFSSG